MTVNDSKRAGKASVNTVAEYFDVSTSTIWRWVGENKFPKPQKIGPRCTRWDWADVENHTNNPIN